MTEQINDQISAFIDDELPDEESAFLLRRFERDPEAHGQALRYTLIGSRAAQRAARPRSRDSAPQDRGRARRQSAGACEHGRKLVGSLGTARPLLGFGIAASVAVAAIVGMRMVNYAQVAPSGAVAPLVARDVERVEPVPAR